MADQTLARYVNEFRILSMLRTGGQATRADIARRLSLTPATITRLISSLNERGLVREVDDLPRRSQPREPGRPGVSVAVNPEGAYFLGVEIGVGDLRLALIDLNATVVNAAEFRVSHLTLRPMKPSGPSPIIWFCSNMTSDFAARSRDSASLCRDWSRPRDISSICPSSAGGM